MIAAAPFPPPQKQQQEQQVTTTHTVYENTEKSHEINEINVIFLRIKRQTLIELRVFQSQKLDLVINES